VSDFRGARGSNTGDDYHELWAARHALRLLDDRDPLRALTVEGIAPVDEASASDATWDGVDCALYEGGRSAPEASRIVLEQLKYSAANPRSPWTVARLVQGEKREESVLHRLARAWSGIRALRPGGPVEVLLVTNQPIASAVETATAAIAKGGIARPRARPAKNAPDATTLAYAAGLTKKNLPAFASALRFRGGTGSRFAIEEQLLADMVGWADLELQKTVADLRQFIRNRMRPEFKGEIITKESVLLGLGVSSMGALFPCPPVLKQITDPVSRGSVAEAAQRIFAGEQHICLHGPGGIGKTTALQQIEAALPAHSVMVTFDCYGGGTFMDAGTLRHRPDDAFLQLSNELATRLRMPILLGRHQIADPARHFLNRLRHAAQAHGAEYPDALIVIAIDAADNAVTAAASRKPAEACFVHDFATLGELPANVRFVVTARTGRLAGIALPRSFLMAEIQPFTREDTETHVRRTWNAPAVWLDAFHRLTAGVPRVQSYAMDLGDAHPENAIERLLPGGRTLDQVFREQFERALVKGGSPSDVAKFCAGLIALARPVPLADLAAVLAIPEPALVDICADMAPAIRLEGGRVSFADEDFEHFVREQSMPALEEVTAAAAAWLAARCGTDAYAAQHVAGALVAAGKGGELLDLVEGEPSPAIIADPVQRREAELTRLRLAISVCRNAGDAARAMRFVLIGAEGLRTERALRALLSDNPDLAVRFAPETAGRLILTDPDQIGYHGAFLLHKQVIDAIAGDRISLREGGRLIQAWMAARKEHLKNPRRSGWRLGITDVAASVEATLRVGGPDKALASLWQWKPMRLRLEVARLLVPRLLAQGEGDLLQAILDTKRLQPWEALFLLVPMAMAGMPIDATLLAEGLAGIRARLLSIARFLSASASTGDLQAWIVDMAMAACELLAANKAAAALVDDFLDEVLRPANRQIARYSTGATTQLNLLFRAHALHAARSGQVPDPATLYEPRPPPVDKEERQRRAHHEDEADRKLSELTASFYPAYAATAMALAGRLAPDALEAMLEAAAKRRQDDQWRFSRELGGRALAMAAARSTLILLASDVGPHMLTGMARRVHGYWGTADLSPDVEFAERLALRPALHPSIVIDIDKAASEIRGRRMGAEDKSKSLLAYARLLLPISPDEANAVFHNAVEAASQLDREIMAQLRLLGVLFKRGLAVVEDKRAAARDLSEVLADAAIRLDEEAELPWEEVMEILAALDLPLALANTAKWDDADLASFRHTLAPVLKSGLDRGELSSAEAMALDLFLRGDHGVITAALDRLDGDTPPGPFLEEAAWDALIRHDHRSNEALATRITEVQWAGRWAKALIERDKFLATLPEGEPVASGQQRGPVPMRDKAAPGRPTWTRDILLDPEAFSRVLETRLEEARADEHFISASEIIGWAAESVAPRDRVAFLDMLRGLKAGIPGEVTDKLLSLVEQWHSPALRSWGATKLPEVIAARLPDFIRYIAHGETSLPRALERTGLGSSQIIDLLLRGVELHGQGLGGNQVFALAGLIGQHLDGEAAARLGEWYARRLADRVEPDDRDQTWLAAVVPETVPAAVARFLHACMGDYDVRVRWRAAHAVRRLARLGEEEVLRAFVAEHGRRDEALFRSPRLDFYWIAARLWFVIAWDRVAGEVPRLGAVAAPALLAIALDHDFPHLLVQSFARDACLKLVAAEQLRLGPAELEKLHGVARSHLAPQPAPEGRPRGRRGYVRDEGRRFHFDPMDSIPYWYDPMLDAFADVSQDQLLSTAEDWIIDRWGYPGDIRAYDAERRRHRFSDRDWSLTSNRHGANPTLERLNNHLEWHGLWCAAGELLRTEPLIAGEHLDWDALPRRIAREMLTEPPLWSSDLREPVPLRSDFWREHREPLAEWVTLVREERMRGELLPVDRPGYVLVGGSWHIRTYDRIEDVACASALVEPALAASLLRAVQTMDSAWDYGIPREGEDYDLDPDKGPYRMIPWLRTLSSDGGVDDLDGLRGNASLVDWQPGRRVSEACALQRGPARAPLWTAPGRPPMFVYEVWGEHDRDDDRYRPTMAVAGRRLLVERTQLQEFLARERLELVIEVEVRREGRDNRRSYDPEDQMPDSPYDRVYRLDGAGGLHAAEGCVGAWADNRPSA
jgi:hypothetical protein